MNNGYPDSVHLGKEKLVDGHRLLDILFDPHCRPSMDFLTSLRNKGLIPYHRICRRIYYYPSEVKEAIEQNLKVKGGRFG